MLAVELGHGFVVQFPSFNMSPGQEQEGTFRTVSKDRLAELSAGPAAGPLTRDDGGYIQLLRHHHAPSPFRCLDSVDGQGAVTMEAGSPVIQNRWYV